MNYRIEEPQTEPFEPHKVKDETWKTLRKVADRLKTMNKLTHRQAFQLFRKWADDRLLYHSQVKPMLFYTIVSNIIKHRSIKIGRSFQDPRIPLLIYMPSGSGKYIILEMLYETNNRIKEILRAEINDALAVFEIESKRLNYDKKQRITDQALLGTVIRTEDGWIAQLGAEGLSSVLVINEASSFFNSDDSSTKNVFPYVCEALDPIGSEANVVSKQLTGRPSLKYRTETNFVLFCQPERANLTEEIITSGTLPRFIIVYSPVGENYHEEVLAFRMNHEPQTSSKDTSLLAIFFSTLFHDDRKFILTNEAEKQIIHEMNRLVSFSSSDRVSSMYVKTAYQRIANMLIKMGACNCACRYDYKISKEDVKRAAIDYRATYITAMAFFTNFVTYVSQRKQRIFELMQVIEELWIEGFNGYRGITPIKKLYEKLAQDKRWNITERSIRNLLSSMEQGRFLKYDRGVSRKPGFIVDLREYDDDEYSKWLVRYVGEEDAD